MERGNIRSSCVTGCSNRILAVRCSVVTMPPTSNLLILSSLSTTFCTLAQCSEGMSVFDLSDGHGHGYLITPTFVLPFGCRSCGRAFKHKQTMFRHRKLCEGNFNFACYVCGKRFYRRDSYQGHLENQHHAVDEMKGKLKKRRV